jgi:hypothetical protein
LTVTELSDHSLSIEEIEAELSRDLEAEAKESNIAGGSMRAVYGPG